MAQFIQYLYEYENGEPVRNLGFMKVDKQMDKTVIQIYAKQLDEISGIQFQRENGTKYLATWTPGEEVQPPMQPPPMQPPTQRPPMQPPMQPPPMQPPTQRPPMQPPMQPPTQQPPIQPPTQQPPMQPPTQRPPEQPPMQPPTQRPPQQPGVDEMELAEEVSAYITPSTRRYEKIQRQDLSRLPRKEWKLANNNFLLHGFYNYHHLLYMEDGDKIWIGVPGIYHEKEKEAAKAFGFPEFQRLTNTEIELSDDEKNTYDDFGYWCRQVEAKTR